MSLLTTTPQICLHPTGSTNLPARLLNAGGQRQTSQRYPPRSVWIQTSLRRSRPEGLAGKAGSTMSCARPLDFNNQTVSLALRLMIRLLVITTHGVLNGALQ